MAEAKANIKIGAEGVSQFKKQMKDAADSVKLLNSEEKLAESQFKLTGDAEQYAADKARILQEKIEAQNKAVAAAEEALKKLKDNGVDANDKAVQEWQTKLNNAKTKLNEMQGELQGATKETENLGQAMVTFDSEQRFANTLQTVKDMRDQLNGVVKAAAQAAKSIWGMGTDAGKWADELMTSATQAGVDVETYQSWQYASRFIDTSVDTIVAARERVINSIRGEGEEAGKAFDELGIGIKNNDGTLRDATEVLFDYVDALQQIQDPTARAAAAEEVLGKNWRAMQPLIEAGSQAYRDMAEEGRQVAVVDAERVQGLSDLNDAQQKLDAQLQKSKETMLAELAPAFQTVAEAMGTAVSAFNDFLASEEGQAAFQALADAVSDLIGSFLGDDNGAGTFASIVETAKNAVEAFTTALNWISEHGSLVTALLTGLTAAWAGLNVAPTVMEFLHLIKGFPTSKIQAMMGGASGTGAASAAGKAASVAANAAAIGGGAANVLAAAVPVALPAAVIGGVAAYQAAERKGYNAQQDARLDAFSEAAAAADEANIGKMTEMADIMERGSEAMKSWDPAKVDAVLKSLKDADLDGVLSEDTAARLQKFLNPETNTFEGWEVDQLLTDILNEVTAFAQDLYNQSEIAGENASIGMADGINARSGEAIAAAEALANQVAATMQSALDIHSPSKVMEKLGEYVGLGFAQGIDSQMGAVERAMDGMISATQRTPARPTAAHAMQASGPRRVVLQIDKTQLCEVLVDDMDTALGAVVRNRR